jgi:hypothetical protein
MSSRASEKSCNRALKDSSAAYSAGGWAPHFSERAPHCSSVFQQGQSFFLFCRVQLFIFHHFLDNRTVFPNDPAALGRLIVKLEQFRRRLGVAEGHPQGEKEWQKAGNG